MADSVSAPILGFNDPRGLIPYIRATAQAYGIDPDTAVRVAASEGLSNPTGDKGKSFGAFQLYTGGGLGNEFQRATGLDPSDPNNEQAGIDYALKYASQHGWGAFHGAKNTGIGPFQGITIGSGMNIGPTLGAPQPPAQQPQLAAAQPQQQQLPAPASSGEVPQPQQQQMLGLQLSPLQFSRPRLNLAPLQQVMSQFHPTIRPYSFPG